MFSTNKANRFALFFIVHFITGSLLLSIGMSYFSFFSNDALSIGFTQITLVFLPLIYYFIAYQTPVKKTLRLYKTHPLNYLLSILLALFSLPIVMLINLLSQFFVEQALEDTLVNIVKQPFWLSFLVIAVFPALFEELITRGIIMSHYRNMKLSTTIFISGFFFGMMHMNINQFLYAFFLGAVFAFVVHMTGSITCSMVMHFVVNGINISLAYLSSSEIFSQLADSSDMASLLEGDKTQMLLSALPSVVIMLITVLPLFVATIFAFIFFNQKMDLIKENAKSSLFFPKEDQDLPILDFPQKKESVLTPSLIIASSLFILLSLLNELS